MTSLDHLSSPPTGRATAPGSPTATNGSSQQRDEVGFATVLHDAERRPADAGTGAAERDEPRDSGETSGSGTEATHPPATTAVPPDGRSTEPAAPVRSDRERVEATVPAGSVASVTGDSAAAAAAVLAGDADAASTSTAHQDPQPPRPAAGTVSADAQRPPGTSADGASDASTELPTSGAAVDRRTVTPDRPSGSATDRVEAKVMPPATSESDAGAVDDLARPDARPPDANATRTEAVRLSPGLAGPDRAAEQLAWRELFDRIDRHRLSTTGALELEIATERFGLLRVEAAEGRDGVHLSLRGDEASHRELADLADELRQQFGREGGGPTDVDVGEDEAQPRPDDDADVADDADITRASPATDAATEPTTTELRAGDAVRSALDLRL